MTHATDIKQQHPIKFKGFKKLVFVGSNSAESFLDTTRQLHFHPNSSFLNQSQIGSLIKIERIYAERDITRQLNNLGLKSGKIAKLINRTSNGSIVIDLNGILIGIGSQVARQIVVTTNNKTL
jgi:Fe2+ transport system protein FeoA